MSLGYGSFSLCLSLIICSSCCSCWDTRKQKTLMIITSDGVNSSFSGCPWSSDRFRWCCPDAKLCWCLSYWAGPRKFSRLPPPEGIWNSKSFVEETFLRPLHFFTFAGLLIWHTPLAVHVCVVHPRNSFSFSSTVHLQFINSSSTFHHHLCSFASNKNLL